MTRGFRGAWGYKQDLGLQFQLARYTLISGGYDAMIQPLTSVIFNGHLRVTLLCVAGGLKAFFHPVRNATIGLTIQVD